MNCIAYPYGRAEALNENYVIASYRVYGVRPENALKKFGSFAVGQTVGTWMKVPGITDEMVELYQARVIAFELAAEEPEYVFLLRVAFPTANFAGSFAALLTGILGNDVSTSLEVRLVNLEFTRDSAGDLGYSKKTVSPIGKLRKMTGVSDRPLLLNMIKPCVGFSPETGAGFFKAAALGGIDLIKDDELLTNPAYSQVEKRVICYRKAALEAAEVTGKETIYVPNITDRPQKMREHAKAAVAAGAKACLINYVFTGLDAFSEICHEFEDDLFVMGHYAGIGVMGGRKCGLANPVYLGMLPRIAGADAVMTMYAAKENASELMGFYQSVQQQMGQIPGMDKIVTTVGGGITPLHIPDIIKDLGNDVIIGIGGAVQGHPMGAEKGAEAAVKAAEAAYKGETLKEAAKKCEPLKKALELWGQSERRDHV